ncbi:MAG TPA: hypothetical protein VLK65_10210 [Vicinamibacteria bacterium]|nr:hypothetical protein [Vicinamibacteria bacterium]
MVANYARVLAALLILLVPTMSWGGPTFAIWHGTISDNTPRDLVPAGTVPNQTAHGCSLEWAIAESLTGQTEIGTSTSLRFGFTESVERLAGLTFALQSNGSVTVQRTGVSNFNSYDVVVELKCV